MKCLFYFFALLQTFHDFLDFHDFITDYPYRNFPGRGVYLNAFSLFDFFGFIVTYKVQKVMCLFPDAELFHHFHVDQRLRLLGGVMAVALILIRTLLPRVVTRAAVEEGSEGFPALGGTSLLVSRVG
jgi:hypothetical protein